MAGWAAAAQAGGQLLSGWLQYKGQKAANQTNINLQQQDEQWQTQMANTAHQREVKDLVAAGLNPILSATGGSGAATPNIAPAQVQNALGGFSSSAKGAGDTLANMIALKQMQASTDNIQATTEQIRSNTMDRQLNTAKLIADIGVSEQARKTGVQSEMATAAQAAKTAADTENALAANPGVRADSSAKQAEAAVSTDTIRANIAKRQAEAQSAGYAADQAKAESAYFGSNATASGVSKGLQPVLELFKFIRMMTAHGH